MRYSLVWFVGLLALVFAARRSCAVEPSEALAAYVEQPDDSFAWVERRQGELDGQAYVELTLTSQTWHDIVWKHQLFILKPKRLRDASRALLLIGGGNWHDDLAAPAKDPQAELPREAPLLAALATEIGAPVAVLLNVPRQPIFNGMREDEIISYTFEQFLKTGDSSWPLLLPMVKSAVRGMDAVRQFAQRQWQFDIEHFTLTGASKRGWTTWLTSAVDPRVQALAPMVIDVVNMGPQMKHQIATWGKFSEQIEDYTRRGIQDRDDSAEGASLRAIVDPYSYRELLVQPKLILLGTNDRYWPLDALNLYWDGLVGEKHVLYVPNQGHGLRDLERVVGTIAALHRQAAGELKLPEMSWDLKQADGLLRLRLRSNVRPTQALAWVATSASRDFRESKWESRPAELVDGTLRYDMPEPKTGFAALFGEAKFDTGTLPYYLSTNVKIVGGDGGDAPEPEKK
ncbi:MAG TPA: PhoPQ-activated protein PqaA family protein [Pirellulales bacterium]|nr:PhoPQ-activated protein PqaA family protein [Pirellulales bacterium]